MRQFTTNEKKYWRIITSILSLFFIMVAIWSIFGALSSEASVESRNTKYRITTASNHGFILKNGELSSSKEAARNQISKIDIIYEYSISMSEYFNSGATYYIKTTVNKKTGSKLESINEDTVKLVNVPIENDGVGTFTLNEKLTIDYSYFSKFIQDEANYFISVSMFVDNKIDIISDNNSFLEKNVVSLNIPLTGEKIEIESTRQFADKTISSNLYVEKPANYLLVIISVLTIVFVLPLTISSFKEVYRLTSYSYYEGKLRYINKKYAKAIVEMEKRPTFNPTMTIDVKGIDELSEISKELSLPMQSYTDDDKSQIIYSVVGLKMTYRYILHI